MLGQRLDVNKLKIIFPCLFTGDKKVIESRHLLRGRRPFNGLRHQKPQFFK